MAKLLVSVALSLLVAIDTACGLICYVGTSGSLTTMSGCSTCQKTTAAGATSATCVSTTCYPGTTSISGYTVTTTCCSTDYCNSIGGASTGGSGGLTCYSGSQGALYTQSGCTSCQKITSSNGVGVSTFSSACLTTSCTPGSISAAGYTVTTSCCSTNNCNGAIAGIGTGGLSCYEGPAGALMSRSGCTSCQKYVLSGSFSSSYSYCLTTSCTAGTTSYFGTTATTYCCSTDNCNDETFVGDGLRCYEGSVGSRVSKSGCKSCQKTISSGGVMDISVSSCLSTTCSPGSYSLGSMSVKTFCCSTDNCNSASKRRVAVPFAVFMAASALWASLRN